MSALRSVRVGDDPKAWSELGFCVVGSQVTLGRVRIELAGTDNGRGILGWSMAGIGDVIDGLPIASPPQGSFEQTRAVSHRNGIFGLDHVAVETSDLERTLRGFQAAGFTPQRRNIGEGSDPATERILFWAGRTIISVSGPTTTQTSGKPTAQFVGLALVSDDLDRTADLLGDALSAPIDSKQSGRRVSKLTARAAGISIPITIMSTHVSAGIEQIAQDERSGAEPLG